MKSFLNWANWLAFIKLYGTPTKLKEVLKFEVIFISPNFASLVVISTTPFPALAPYIAVAEASFSTSIFSISSGLRPAKGFVAV